MYKVHVRRTAVLAILGVVAGLMIYVFSSKIYEANIEVLLGSNLETRGPSMVFDDEVRKIIDRNAPQGIQTERQLLNSETVYIQALQQAAPQLMTNWEKYYLMYDVVTARTPNNNEQGAGVAQVRVRAYDPKVAGKIAEAVTDSYNQIRQKAGRDSVMDAINYITAQIDATDRDLKSSEAAYQKYKEENLLASVERQQNNITDNENQLQTALVSANAEMSGNEETIKSLTALIAKIPPRISDSSSSVRNPIIDALERQITDLELSRTALLTQYTEDNPKVKANGEVLAGARLQLAEAKKTASVTGYSTERLDPIRTDLEARLVQAKAGRDAIMGRMQSLRTSLDEADRKLAASPEQEVKITQLQRDRIIFDEKYRRLKSQLEELTNRQETGVIYAVPLGTGSATVSDRPVAPDAVKLSFIGFIAGACIGLVMSFTLEALRPRVYTSGQLADLTGLPVVASIPSLPGLSRSRAVESLARQGGLPLESFRNMAYTYLASGGATGQSVMFTGIGASGSSSICAAQFAVALAHAGTKVILVDAERTRQVITNGFGATDKKGLSNVFQDGSDPASLLVETKHKNLTLLPIGTVPEALMSEAGLDRVEKVVASLKQHAQVVVISVAPSDIVADAAAFASRVDEVCLSVSAKTNDYGSVPTAYEILDKAGARSVKLILTDTGRDGEPFTASTSITRAV